MVKTRKERAGNAHVKLRQPDRSGPTEKTLLDFAHEQNLFQQVQQREKEMAKERRKQSIADGDDDDGEVPTLSPGAERALEAALWTATIAMLHFTFDVLVQHQYGQEISWAHVCTRTGRAWLGTICPQFPHEAPASILTGLTNLFFFVAQFFYFYFISSTHSNPMLSCCQGCRADISGR